MIIFGHVRKIRRFLKPNERGERQILKNRYKKVCVNNLTYYDPVYYCDGRGYYISNKSCNIILSNYDNITKNKKEDRANAYILSINKIYPYHIVIIFNYCKEVNNLKEH